MRYRYKSGRTVLKRTITFLLIGVMLLFLLDGMRLLATSYWRYKLRMKELNRCIEENKKLKQKLALLENNLQMIEKLARKEGMCYPGEKIYRIVKIKN